MRNHCCEGDYDGDDDCSLVDCDAPRKGKCVPKADCMDDNFFFNQFSGKCDFKYSDLWSGYCDEFYDFDDNSRLCETYNPCD